MQNHCPGSKVPLPLSGGTRAGSARQPQLGTPWIGSPLPGARSELSPPARTMLSALQKHFPAAWSPGGLSTAGASQAQLGHRLSQGSAQAVSGKRDSEVNPQQ